MGHEILFDCFQCGHTIKSNSDLVGRRVACPDCGRNLKVPDVRNGILPQFRTQETGEGSSTLGELKGLMDDLKQLEQGMLSLLRRQQSQMDQVDFIESNALLMLKQFQMLNNGIPRSMTQISETPAGEAVAEGHWLRWSLACAGLTLVGTMIFATLLLQSL